MAELHHVDDPRPSPDGNTPKQSDSVTGWLMLAPLDMDARSALTRILPALDVPFEVREPVLLLPYGAAGVHALADRLAQSLAPGLQDCVKGALLRRKPGDDHDMMMALLRATALDELLQTVEFDWARSVVEYDRVHSVFQPIVEAETGDVFAYEALLRARRGDTGDEVGPGQLFYACERVGMLYQLDERARRSAISCAAKLGVPDTRFFVNFMPRTMFDAEVCFRSTVECAHRHGLDMGRLVFEIAETEQNGDTRRLAEILAHYRHVGAGVALDDITAGFASMQSVADLVPDYVKVDRHLIASAPGNPNARGTLEAIVRHAAQMGVKVVAVGIETVDQMRVCVDAGVDYLQGFLFARPAFPPAQVNRHLFVSHAHAA